MIQVDEGAQSTDAFQESRNLLLSKKAHADAIPGLEILANEDPTKPSPRLEGFLRRHQGGHIICFNSEDLPSVERRLLAP